MESDIIVEGFSQSVRMHGLRYKWMVGDGDSSVHQSIIRNVPYRREVEKIECCNHTVKCFQGSMEKLVKDNTIFKGKMA